MYTCATPKSYPVQNTPERSEESKSLGVPNPKPQPNSTKRLNPLTITESTLHREPESPMPLGLRVQDSGLGGMGCSALKKISLNRLRRTSETNPTCSQNPKTLNPKPPKSPQAPDGFAKPPAAPLICLPREARPAPALPWSYGRPLNPKANP